MIDLVPFEQLISAIYEAAVVTTQWPKLIDRISHQIGGVGGHLFGVRDGYVSAVSSDGVALVYERFVEGGWNERDPRLPRAMMLNHPGFVTDQDLLTDEEIATNDVYENFFRPQGIGYVAGSFIPNPSGDSVAFAFQRHHESGPVPRDVVTALDKLRPHLARASMLSFRLGFERARAQADALQVLGLPGAVLRGPGRIFAANALFEALMPSLFLDRTHRLMLTDVTADDLLAHGLADLPRAGSNAVASIPVGATEGRIPMILHLLPVRGAANDIFTQATALLVVTPVDRAVVPTAEVLQGLFDLTPAEARVARGIAQALTVDALAEVNGVARETVRGQLKAVLAKTGLTRQQELISLLAGKALP